eukprot:2438956-Rhodomonas_salina.1
MSTAGAFLAHAVLGERCLITCVSAACAPVHWHCPTVCDHWSGPGRARTSGFKLDQCQVHFLRPPRVAPGRVAPARAAGLGVAAAGLGVARTGARAGALRVPGSWYSECDGASRGVSVGGSTFWGAAGALAAPPKLKEDVGFA